MSSFMPFASGGMSAGTQSMMGRPVGGFNPSPSEYLLHRVNNESMARYMRDIYKGDPRTSAFADMLLQASFGADSKRRQATVERLGGMGNLQELIGFTMSQPGISGYMGGPAGLGIGAYAAAASGMGINGRIMAGDGPLVQQMAKSLYSSVSSRFFTGSGAQLPGMTSGLNRDQLGGLMSIMGSQGAFRDMDLGKLTMGSNGQPSVSTNPTQINQFISTIKNGAKALGAIMDVYGDASVSELFSKAQQITGLNFANPQNAQVMAQRLTSLRRTGQMFGIDAQTMFDASKMGISMAQSMGMTGHLAAFSATSSAENAARLSIGVASGRSTIAGGFIPTMQEIQAGNIRDTAGMAYDPIGMRRGLVSMILAQGGIPDAKSRGEIQDMMTTAGVGGANEHQIDAMMRSHGFELPNMIRQFGGAGGIMKNLSASQAEEVAAQNAGDMERRASFRIRQRYINPTFGGAGGAAELLRSTFEPGTLSDMFDPSKMSDALQRSVEARRDPGRYRQAVADVLAASGGSAADAKAKFAMVDMMARTDPLTTSVISGQAKDNASRLAQSNIPGFTTEDQRGFTKVGFLDGILNRYGGTDARSNFARLMTNNPGAIAGGIAGMGLPMEGDQFDVKKMTALANQFQKQFSGSTAGQNLLREMGLVDETGKNTTIRDMDANKLFNQLTNPTQRQLLFRNFQEFRMNNRSAFAPKTLMDESQQFGGLVDVAKLAVNKGAVTGASMDYLMAAGIAVGDATHRIFEVRGGKAGRVLGNLTAEQLQDQANQIMKQTTSLDVLQKIGAGAVGDIARMNHQWGQTAMETLNNKESDLRATGTDDPRMMADIKKLKDALKAKGISATSPGTMVLTGSLRLGDKELELVNTSLKESKK